MWQYFIIFVGSVNFHCIECFFHKLLWLTKKTILNILISKQPLVCHMD